MQFHDGVWAVILTVTLVCSGVQRWRKRADYRSGKVKSARRKTYPYRPVMRYVGAIFFVAMAAGFGVYLVDGARHHDWVRVYVAAFMVVFAVWAIRLQFVWGRDVTPEEKKQTRYTYRRPWSFWVYAAPMAVLVPFCVVLAVVRAVQGEWSEAGLVLLVGLAVALFVWLSSKVKIPRQVN